MVSKLGLISDNMPILRIYIDGSYETLPQTCIQCRFAHDLNMKLLSCNENFESIIYCDKRECICKAERPACDWAAFDVK